MGILSQGLYITWVYIKGMGRPKGSWKLNPELLIDYIGILPQTTNRITRLLKIKYPKINHKTTQKYLLYLKERGYIKGNNTSTEADRGIYLWYK